MRLIFSAFFGAGQNGLILTQKMNMINGREPTLVNQTILGQVFSEAQQVFNSLADEKSKTLFSLRLLFNLTNDYDHILDMVSLIPEFDMDNTDSFRKFYNQLRTVRRDFPKSKFIIYGAGARGKHVYDLFSCLEWHSFCDKDPEKQNLLYCGLPVISPERLVIDHKDDFVVIAIRDKYDEVYQELTSKGFPGDHILSDNIQFLVQCLNDKQYFEYPIVMPEENEVFVDAGCFNCDTSKTFMKWCHDNYAKIYAFEPDPSNYANCKKIIEQDGMGKIELIHAGLWSRNDTIAFEGEEGSASAFKDEGSFRVNVVSLDEVLKDHRVSFIKMDIEGAELEALKGAKNTIVNYRPRLAICVYHKPEDILEIPLYLKHLVPDYKFYIRHYSNHTIETVLYAI